MLIFKLGVLAWELKSHSIHLKKRTTFCSSLADSLALVEMKIPVYLVRMQNYLRMQVAVFNRYEKVPIMKGRTFKVKKFSLFEASDSISFNRLPSSQGQWLIFSRKSQKIDLLFSFWQSNFPDMLPQRLSNHRFRSLELLSHHQAVVIAPPKCTQCFFSLASLTLKTSITERMNQIGQKKEFAQVATITASKCSSLKKVGSLDQSQVALSLAFERCYSPFISILRPSFRPSVIAHTTLLG